MKIHLPYALRLALIMAQCLPLQAVLTWNSGNWNTADASWLDAGTPAVFANGDAVEFGSAASSPLVNITEQVEPASMVVSSSAFVFSGAGQIAGSSSLTLDAGASLRVENNNSFTGGTRVATGAALSLTQFSGVGSVNTSERSLGTIEGTGELVLAFADAVTRCSIYGNALQNFTGTLTVQQATVGLGRGVGHSGAGAVANLGASRVNVTGAGSFTTTLGGGSRSLVTGRTFSCNVYTEDGATIGNRDGNVNWSGNVYLNMQDATAATPAYSDSATTTFSMYYGKYVVWNGVVSGAGTLELSAGAPDSNSDHRLVLTNSGNTFQGTYQVNGEYLSTLAIASSAAASAASVQLNSGNARLALMNTNGTIASLNGAQGVVFAEGSSACILSVGSGAFSGIIQDSLAPAAGLSLGITKYGSGTLALNGENCTYTGATTVQEGVLQFSGATTLGCVNMAASSARLSIDGNLTLLAGANLSFAVDGTTGASITATGGLSLSDIAHGVTVSGYENLPLGTYQLMSWSTASPVSMHDFAAGGFNDTADFIYSLQVQGNALQLVVGDMGEVPWLWKAGSATWADDSAAQWSNSSGSGPAGQQLTFSARNAGTVIIDRVTPTGISVNGGQYVFTAASAASEGIVSGGTLSVSGESTLLQLNLANTMLTGSVMLKGGVLEMGNANALGSASLYFHGGVLRYGSGVSSDVSSRIHSGSISAVKVDTNGNTVTWSDVDGVKQTLSSGIEKLGDGKLSLEWSAANETRSGAVQVQGGTLAILKSGTRGTLAGTISGSGTLQLTAAAGQLNVTADNSAFAGTIALVGDGQSNTGSVSFASGNALGGADTTVLVSGQRFWFANNTSTAANLVVADGTTTYFDGSTGRSYSFTGNISGSGTLQVKPSCSMSMSGDISSFTGSFVHPGSSAVTWLLGGDGVNGTGLVQANLNSSGSAAAYAFMYSAPVTMSGVVSGRANLHQQGEGQLILTGQNTSTGTLTIDEGCQVRLGSANASASWSGTSQLGGGQFTLVNGVLNTAVSTLEGVLVADVAAGGTVDMGGTNGCYLQSVQIGAGGQLIGVNGDLTIGASSGAQSMLLTLAPVNVGASATLASGEEFMIGIEGGALIIQDAAQVTLDMETIKSVLQGRRKAVYLHVSNADLVLQNGISAADLFASSATTPAALGLVVLGVDGGNIVLEGAVREVYMVMQDGDYDVVTSYTRLQPYLATFVDSGYTLSLNLPGDNTQAAWVNNLLGGGNFSVSNTDELSGIVRVMLNNEFLGDISGVLTPPADSMIQAANSEILGNVTAGTAVQLVKTGSGTLSVGGTLVADWLEIDEGTLRLAGEGNRVNTLHGEGNLKLDGSLEIAGNALDFGGVLEGDGVLILNGIMKGNASIGSLRGTGELRAAGTTMEVRNGTDSSFSGRLADGDGLGVLSLLPGNGEFTLNAAQTNRAWSISNAGKLKLNQSTNSGSNATLTLNSLELLAGSDTTLVLNTDSSMQVFSLSSLIVEDSAAITLQSTGSLPLELGEDGAVLLGTVESGNLGNDGQVTVNLAPSLVFNNVEGAWLTLENGQLLLHAQLREANKYAAAASSRNGQTGASLLWRLPNNVLRQSPTLAELTQVLNHLVDAGNTDAADELLAAVAGAGAAALGNAALGDIQRQLKAIRNRTTHMGLDTSLEYDNLPLFNAWMNAEGDRRELDSEGTDSGYTLSTWGATVGCDLDFSTHLTAGLALTAMYGDFNASSVDDAHGDMDTYYVTLFGRYVRHRWSNTLVCALGIMDGELRRRVNFGSGLYHTKGNINGLSFGFLYELGYVIPLDEDNTACIQPIVNLSYTHADVRGYSEHGSDAGLHVGAQSMNVVTFGLGARAQAYGLENMYNRSCLLEARLLLKLDAGDRRSNAVVSLLAEPSRGGRIRSAEQGIVGMEMGAGLTIPLGENGGNLFLDAAFECRADEAEVNGTVGYRMNF